MKLLESLTLEDLLSFSEGYLNHLYFTGFIGGNISIDIAKEYHMKFNEIMNFKPVQLDHLSGINIMKLPSKSNIVKKIYSTSQKATTSLCMVYL